MLINFTPNVANYEKHTVYIIGAGVIRKVLAVLLQKENRTVVLVRGSVDDGSSQNSQIGLILNVGQKIRS